MSAQTLFSVYKNRYLGKQLQYVDILPCKYYYLITVNPLIDTFLDLTNFCPVKSSKNMPINYDSKVLYLKLCSLIIREYLLFITVFWLFLIFLKNKRWLGLYLRPLTIFLLYFQVQFYLWTVQCEDRVLTVVGGRRL